MFEIKLDIINRNTISVLTSEKVLDKILTFRFVSVLFIAIIFFLLGIFFGTKYLFFFVVFIIIYRVILLPKYYRYIRKKETDWIHKINNIGTICIDEQQVFINSNSGNIRITKDSIESIIISDCKYKDSPSYLSGTTFVPISNGVSEIVFKLKNGQELSYCIFIVNEYDYVKFKTALSFLKNTYNFNIKEFFYC